VVLGPGSFYTSILAATLAPDVVEALSVRSGPMVLVANLLSDVESPVLIADQLEVLEDHGIRPDVVLVDDAFEGATSGPCPVKRAPVSAPDGLIHDPAALGAALAACSVANL
jgi:2-phospho-L-lactate transferase/gluconeogenesis factor (CofD/UPF0052 family)